MTTLQKPDASAPARTRFDGPAGRGPAPWAVASAVGILAMAVEREFASDRKDLLFDYAPGSGADGRPAALLVAAQRQTVDDLAAAARAAGLTVSAVTASTLALAALADGGPGGADAAGRAGPAGEPAAAREAGGERMVLRVSVDGTELAVGSSGGVRMLRRLAAAPTTGAACWNRWWRDIVVWTFNASFGRMRLLPGQRCTNSWKPRATCTPSACRATTCWSVRLSLF